MYAYCNVLDPCLNLYRRCNPKNTSVIRIGISAGYIFKLSVKLPFSNSIIDRCIPHPGQSNPNNALLGQGTR